MFAKADQAHHDCHVESLDIAPKLVRRELVLVRNIEIETSEWWLWYGLDMVHLLPKKVSRIEIPRNR